MSDGTISQDTTVLTTGVDVVLGTASDDTVQAIAATLTAGTSSYNGTTTTYTGGDQLSGGAGYDTLALFGGGSFNLSTLGQFDGFEEVRLTNAGSASANLVLRDGVDLKVVLSDGTAPATSPYFYSSAGETTVALGTGRVTVQGGNERDTITAAAPNKLVAGSRFDGGAGTDMLVLNYDTTPVPGTGTSVYDPAKGFSTYVPPVYRDSVYDLTKVGLTGVETLRLTGSYAFNGGSTTTIVKVDTAALSEVTSLEFFSGGRLSTDAASLDLTGKSIYASGGGTITSDNAAGTVFTVSSVATGLQVLGGAGQDTVVFKGLTLTQAQREQMFTGFIETVTDASGTYKKVMTAGPAPTWTSTTETTVAENSVALGSVHADAAGGSVIYSIVPGLDGALFTVDLLTGRLGLAGDRTGLDYENHVGADGRSVYQVTLRATGSNGQSADRTFSVAVTNVDEAASGGIDAGAAIGTASATLGAVNHVVDPDLPGGVALGWQWQKSVNGTTWTDVAGATLSSFAADPATDVSYYRAVGTYTDPFGSHSVASAQTFILGTADTDAITGTAGHDVMAGFAGDDVLHGGAGNDAIKGGDGADRLYGDADDDQLWGGAGNDDLWGGTGNDRLYGEGGNNTLRGEAGNDTLVGASGHDWLDGGTGADTMNGGGGNDTYVVDDACDVVIEAPDAGTDTVLASLSYTLTANVENLTLSGTAPIDGTGNDLANVIRGNAGANTLSGGNGNDTLIGGYGDDILIGGSGRDLLVGGEGRDILTGGADADSFRFEAPNPYVRDRVTDFASKDGDKLVFTASDFGLAQGKGISLDGLLDADYFALDAATASGHGQFVFDTATRLLSFDADGTGSGKGVQIALFDIAPGALRTDFLHASDFLLT